MDKKIKVGCFVVLMLIQISMLLLPSTGSIQLNDGPRVSIYDIVSQGKAVVFTTDQIEWLGAYSANTRVSDINNDNIDDFLLVAMTCASFLVIQVNGQIILLMMQMLR